MTTPSQATLTVTATTKLGNATTTLAFSSQAAIELSFTQPSTVTITNFPTITYPALIINGFTITATVAPFDAAMIAEAGTFNAADGSILIPQLTLQITVNTQSGALVTDLTTGLASSNTLDSGTVFNDQGSPLQASGQVTLVGDGYFWDDDGTRTIFLGMTSGAIELAGTISYPPNTTAVPDVIGDDVPTARNAIASAGLYFEEQRGSPDPILAVPTVANQTPMANSRVQKGTYVTCRVDYPQPSNR